MAVKDWMYRASLAALPPLYRVVSALLFGLCRVEETGTAPLERLLAGGTPLIGLSWHYSVFFAIRWLRGPRWVTMVSGSRDAEYVSRLIESLGYRTVRGSRSKGGLRAIREMTEMMRTDRCNAALIADGSQGPARQVQAGCLLLASQTGAPILPVAWGVSRYLTFRSWDRTILPLPFARIQVVYGEPFWVPEKIKGDDLERCRLEVEARMNGVYAAAWAPFGRKVHADGA